MSDTQQQQVAPAQTYAPAKRGSKVALMLIIFLVALVAFAAAVYFAGGVGYVTSLLGGAPAPSKGTAGGTGSANGAAVVASPTVAAVTPSSTLEPAALEMARLTYAEQIESQVNIRRLTSGEIKSLSVNKIASGDNEGIVDVTARFGDGTSAPGAMRFVRDGQKWYFVTITGLRADDTNGMADTIGAAKEIAPLVSADQKLAEVDVVTPDPGLVNTIAEQQLVNQPVIRDLLAGKYKLYEVGNPVLGPGTFTIPVTFVGPDVERAPASIVVISKKVEGKDLLFITTLATD